jgi:hypothetical protein
MVNVANLAPMDLPETTYFYPDPVLNPTNVNGQFGTTVQIALKRTQGVMRYQLICDSLTISGGTTPTSLVSNLLPVIQHVQIQADDDTLFDVDMVPWLEYQRIVQAQLAAQTGYQFDIDMADMNYRARGQLLPATLLRTFQYAQVVMNVTFAAIATITSGSPTAYSTKVHMTEIDINRDLIDKLPVFVVKKLGATSSYPNQNGPNDLTQAFPQTGLLKTAFFAGQTASSATYANLSDGNIAKMLVILNDSFNETTTTWNLLKRQNQSTFGTNPGTGFALKVWSDTCETGKFLNISDVRKVTSVDLQLTENNVGTTGVIYILRIFYK